MGGGGVGEDTVVESGEGDKRVGAGQAEGEKRVGEVVPVEEEAGVAEVADGRGEEEGGDRGRELHEHPFGGWGAVAEDEPEGPALEEDFERAEEEEERFGVGM